MEGFGCSRARARVGAAGTRAGSIEVADEAAWRSDSSAVPNRCEGRHEGRLVRETRPARPSRHARSPASRFKAWSSSPAACTTAPATTSRSGLRLCGLVPWAVDEVESVFTPAHLSVKRQQPATGRLITEGPGPPTTIRVTATPSFRWPCVRCARIRSGASTAPRRRATHRILFWRGDAGGST